MTQFNHNHLRGTRLESQSPIANDAATAASATAASAKSARRNPSGRVASAAKAIACAIGIIAIIILTLSPLGRPAAAHARSLQQDDQRLWTLDTKDNGRIIVKKHDPEAPTGGRIFTAKSEAADRATVLNEENSAAAAALDADAQLDQIQITVNQTSTTVEGVDQAWVENGPAGLARKIEKLTRVITRAAEKAADALALNQSYLSEAGAAEAAAAAAAQAASDAADAHNLDPHSIDPRQLKALDNQARQAAKEVKRLHSRANSQLRKAGQQSTKHARLITKLDDLLDGTSGQIVYEDPNLNGGQGGGGGGEIFAILQPGDGFDGPTPQPDPIGAPSDPGYDAKAIARWDVVPYQTFDTDFHIGVVAFHMNGIDRVTFSANGGPWTAVEEMQLNPRTDVWEYTALLDPALFEDGPVEVRAIAWPKDAGEPRVLGGDITAASVDLGEHSMQLWANAGQSLPAPVRYVSPTGSDNLGDGSETNPYRSIAKAAKSFEDADGGKVYLLPGQHEWGPAERDSDGNYIGRPQVDSRYLTLTSAPGTPRDDVTLVHGGSGGLKIDRLHVQNLTLSIGIGNSVYPGSEPMLWVDDCDFVGSGRTDAQYWTPPTSWPGGIFIIDSSASNARYGFTAACDVLRNVTIYGLGDDAMVNPRLALNTHVNDIQIPDGSGYHSDVVQYHASATPIQNTIVYGLEAIDCSAQGWHIGYTGHTKGPDWKDMAFVNVLIEADHTQQWIPAAQHVLWWHMTILDGPVSIRNNPDSGGGYGEICVIEDFSMRNCVFNVFALRDGHDAPSIDDQSWANSNHFIDTSTYGAIAVGANATTGGTVATLFEDAGLNNFRPRSATALVNRVNSQLTRSDASGQALQVPAAVGAFQETVHP